MDSFPGGDMGGDPNSRPALSNRSSTPGPSRSSQIIRDAGGASRGFSAPLGRRSSPVFDDNGEEDVKQPRIESEPYRNRVDRTPALDNGRARLQPFEGARPANRERGNSGRDMIHDRRDSFFVHDDDRRGHAQPSEGDVLESSEKIFAGSERANDRHDSYMVIVNHDPVRVEDDDKTLLEKYRQHKAEYEKLLVARENDDTWDVQFLKRDNELKREFIKKREDKRLTAEEKRAIRSKEIRLEAQSLISIKNEYWSRHARRNVEKDFPSKKTPDPESKKRKADNSSSIPNKKSTFDRANYIGEGAKKAGRRAGGNRGGGRGEGHQDLGSDDVRPKGKLGIFSLGQQNKGASEESSVLDSIGLSDIFLASGEATDAPNAPTFSATKTQDALKQMVSNCLTSGPGSKRQKITAREDKKDFQFARRHFHRNNKPQPVTYTDEEGETQNGWLCERMNTPLKNHQLIGVGWIRWKEMSPEEPRGGLFADAMGLGKTIQILAVVMDGCPNKDEKRDGYRATLIVVPSNLLSQWKKEIETHCKNPGRVLYYSSHDRASGNFPLCELNKFDIIVTTYGEVRASYPTADYSPEIKGKVAREAWWDRHFEANKGILHQTHFHRVVLDECQAIKNPKSDTYEASYALMAKYRWLMTGTPFTDGVIELYPFLKFLKARWTGDRRMFKKNYLDDKDSIHTERLKHTLQSIMFRRTHSSQLFGAPILKLPRAYEISLEIKLPKIEYLIYESILDKYTKMIFEAHNNKDGQCKGIILRMIEKLRRCLSHFLLVQDEFESFDRKLLTKIERAFSVPVSDDEKYPKNIIALHRQLYEDAEYAESLTGGDYGRKVNFDKYKKALKLDGPQEARPLRNKLTCHQCRKTPVNLKINHCGHFFCEKCVDDLNERAARAKRETACPRCEAYLDDLHDGTPEEWEKLELARNQTATSTPSSHQKVATKESWITLDGGIIPSTKSLAVKIQVLRWIKENPDCKIILFTQFVDMVKLLKKICEQEGWRCCEIHGQIGIEKRNKTLEQFNIDKNLKILIATTQSGGVGLNLTVASRVLMLEHWWNSATDQQAFCRVWRIGQTEETQFVRLHADRTVDDRVLGTQKSKAERIEEIMHVQEGRDLNVAELMAVFGKRLDGGAAFEFDDDTAIPHGLIPSSPPEAVEDEEMESDSNARDSDDSESSQVEDKSFDWNTWGD